MRTQNQRNNMPMMDYRILALISFMLAFGMFLPFGSAETLGSELITNADFSQIDLVPSNFFFTATCCSPEVFPRTLTEIIVDGIDGKALFFNGSLGLGTVQYVTNNQNFNYSRSFDLSIDYKSGDFLIEEPFIDSGHSGFCSFSDGINPNLFNSSTNNSQCYNGTSGELISETVPFSLGGGWYRSAFHNVTGYENLNNLNLDFIRILDVSGGSNFTIDNINFTYVDTGETLLFDDFENNIELPKDWAVCDFNGNLFCETDTTFTSSMILDSILNLTQNSGDTGDITSSNFTLQADTPYRFVFKWNSTTLSDIINDANLALIFTGSGQNIFIFGLNDTDSTIVSSGNGITISSQSTSIQGNLNVGVVDFTVDTQRIYKIDIFNYQNDKWYLINSVSAKEILPDNNITGLVTGIPATIVTVIVFVIIVGMIIVTYREFQGGRLDTDKLIKIIVGIIISLGFIGAVLTFI